MKKNLSEVTVFRNIRNRKLLNKDKTLEGSHLNNSSLNNSQMQSKNLSVKQNQEQEQEKPKKFNYISHKVQIPIIYYERVKFIKEIFNNDNISFTITYAPSPKMTTTKELGKYFRHKLKNVIEISSCIIYYFYRFLAVNKNIFEKSIKGNSSKNLQDILKQKERTCDEILKSGVINTPKESADLFYEICGYSGVKITTVSGLIKPKNYKRGDTLLKHNWSILNCGIEKNYFIDQLLCLGSIQENGEFSRELKLFYFLTPPLFFLENHLPDEDIYQFIPRPLKVKEFTRKENPYYTEDFYNGVFKYNIELNNRTAPEFECTDSETKIKLTFLESGLNAELYLNDKLLPKEHVDINNKEDLSIYFITLFFPSDGEYKLYFFTKKNEKITRILTYRISVKIKNIIKHEPKKKLIKRKIVLPNFRAQSPLYFSKAKESKEIKLNRCESDFGEKIKNKCYDNKDAHVIEPRNKILRLGHDAKFKIKIRNAKNVVVLDGKRWNYLKRKEADIYEGIIPIKNENIVVCALRNNDIYTEVFEFLAISKL